MYKGSASQAEIGSTNQLLQYRNPGGGTNWITLATIILTTTPYLYVDTNSTFFSSRLYRTVTLP